MERCAIRTHTCRIILGTMLMLVLLLLCAGQARAETVADGSCGENITWTLDDEGTLTISGSGEMEDYQAKEAPWYPHHDSILKISIGEGVKKVGACSFAYLDKASGVEVPDSVESIGKYAFLGSGIETVSLAGDITFGMSAFSSCKSLRSVFLGEGITEISSSMFSSCSNLTEISLPDSLRTIDNHAFDRCEKLEAIDLPDRLTRIYSCAFQKCVSLRSVILPATIDLVDESPFRDCENLEEITLLFCPAGVGRFLYSYTGRICFPEESEWWDETRRAEWAPNATWVPKGLGEIILDSGSCGDNATWQLNNLGVLRISGEGAIADGSYQWGKTHRVRKLIIEEGITGIGEDAFSGYSITSAVIPESVTKIGAHAFMHTALKEITVPGSVKIIEREAFRYCDSLKKVVLEKGVETINSRIFDECLNLEQIEIPDTLKTVGFNAFDKCTSLKQIELPDSLGFIENSTFRNCTSLKEITIPKNIYRIDHNAFTGCSSLEIIGIKCSAPGTITDAIYEYTKTIYYPSNDPFWDEETRTAWAPNATWIPREENDITPEVIAGGTCGENAFWELTNQGVMTISGDGPMAAYGYAERPWHKYLSRIKGVVIEDGITSVAKDAFNDCRNLRTIRLSDSVKEIGKYAFTFAAIEEVTIPENVVRIHEDAFSFTKVKRVRIKGHSVTLDRHVFYRCDQLETIEADTYSDWCRLNFQYPDTNPLGYTAAHLVTGDSGDSVSLSEGITKIPAYSFRGNDKLTSIELPKSLEQVGAEAFDGCSGLKEVEVKNLASWCNTAFETAGSNPLNASADTVLQIGGGTGTKVTLAEGIKQVPDRTFAGWNMLSEVTFPESLKEIGAGAFLGCDSIKTVNAGSLTSWLNTKFATETSSPMNGGAQLRVKNGSRYEAITDPQIDQRVGAIPAYAFSGTDTLKTAVIPEGVTQIGAGAFADCTGLAEVSLPETVTALEEKTFSGCKQLKKILIPQTITRIEYDAFSGCADELIIYGYAGSEAESYANARGITFLPYTEYDAIRAGKLNDNIKWTLSGGTVLTIEGEGTTPDFAEGESPFAAFAGQVSTVKLKGITGLGDHLLQDFTNLKRVDVSLETKLSQISASALSGCGDVEIRCYGNCYDTVSGIVSAEPELSGITVTKLSGSKAGNVTWTYNEDTGTILLTSNGADSFGETFTESPFAELKARRVQFSDAFSCRDIPANLFKDCTTISEVQLPQQVRTIGKEAFKGCANLQTLSWYGDIAQLGEGAFCDCSSLKEIRLEGSVMMDDQGREIKEETIEIPEQVIVIPAGCFKGCSVLRQVDWYEDPEDETAAGVIEAEAFMNCGALNDIAIPDHVGTIAEQAFYGCESLEDRVFCESLQEIGKWAFFGCDRMKEMSFEGDLQSIGEQAIGYYTGSGNKAEVNPGFTITAPESAANLKTYCEASGISFITTSGIIDGDPDQKVYVKIASSVTVKKGRSKSVKYSTNGKVKKVTSSGGGGTVSVTRSGSKIKFRGLRAGNATVHLTFKMKGAGNINKTVYVKVKKSSASLGDGEAQDISVKQKSLTFESDADSPKKISVSGVQTSLLASLSKEGIAEVRVDDNGTVTVTPLRSGQTSLTLQAAEDDVFLASDKVSVGITIKARPARVTAKVKKLSKKKARVTWKKISGATAYQIQVATKKNFKGKKTYKVKAGKTATLKKTVKVKKGKKNYIRVRYLCKGKYSKWSRTLTVKK